MRGPQPPSRGEASKFNARITVHHDGMSASAPSIMDLLMLAPASARPIEIDAEGPEAHQGARGRVQPDRRKFDEKD